MPRKKTVQDTSATKKTPKKNIIDSMIKNNDESNMYKLLILEKKHQNTSGSVSDKLGLGTYFVYEYTKSINNSNVVVEYAFCLSNYLKSEQI